jgi:EAL domain-containing protein (putative c-di-GMP-specific phosphodiesterase class I)
MPETDGLELLRLLGETNFGGDIVLFSAEDSQTLQMAKTLARARGLSVLGAIEKPLQKEEMLRVLSNHAKKTPVQSRRRQVEKLDITDDMLSQAIDTHQIKPWYQPKIRVEDLHPVGVEALARWPNSSYGPISPGVFIPIAEESELIDELTFSIIEQAAQTEQQWRQQGIDLKVAVNLSMNSLHNADFLEHLTRVVEQAGGDLAYMQLEITESQLMEDLVLPLEVLLRLRMKKVRLSIDDFGTGHSNFSQLRDLPFDELKLDRSYVSLDDDSEKSSAILESSVEMANKLKMTIVAEGVENLEEWLRVERLGCHQVQGYFTAKPMPGEEIPAWLQSWPDIRKALFGR